MIGIFVILSLALFMAAIVVFGGAKFFTKENLVITYFEGSLQGLSVGAAVTYRGVTVGEVKEIKIHIQADGDKNQELVIPVLISLSEGDTLIVDGSAKRDETSVNNFLQSMCEQGLRAKLKHHSLVTGKRYVDLAFYENTPAVFRDQAGEYFEIPTLPSEMQQISRFMENVDLEEVSHKMFTTLDSLDKLTAGLSKTLSEPNIQQLVDNLLAATESVNSILSQADSNTGPILKKVNNILNKFNTLTSNADSMVTSLDARIKPLVNNMVTTLSHLDTTLQQADVLLTQAGTTIKPNSPLYYRFTETMTQIEKTARSLEKLSELIYRNPDTLIFGLQKAGENTK